MITHCHKNSFHLISGAKLCLFHISAKGFFPSRMCKNVNTFYPKDSFLLELSAKTWLTICVIWSFNS